MIRRQSPILFHVCLSLMVVTLVLSAALGDQDGDAPSPAGEQALPDGPSLSAQPPASDGNGALEADPNLPAFEADMSASELQLWENIPVVVTPSRKAEPVDVTPNITYVITQDEIKKYGYTRPLDVLVRIPGFFALHGQNIRQYLLQVRGASFGENIKIAFMINGHRINNVNEDSSSQWPVSLDMVKRVEVVVGPGSVMYGADTLLATFNMITKELDGGMLSYTLGVHEFTKRYNQSPDRRVREGEEHFTHLGTAQWGKTWGPDRGVFISSTFARSDGWYSYFDGDPHRPSGPLAVLEPSYSLLATARYDGWFIQYWRLAQDIGPREQSRERHNYVDSVLIRYKHEFSDELTGSAEFSLDHRRMTRRGDFWWRQRLYKAEAGLRYAEGKHNFAAGIQTSFGDNGNNFAKVADKVNGKWTTYRMKAIHDKVSTIIGAYVSEEYDLCDKITLIGALRADHSNVTQDGRLHFSPRAAVIARPTDRWVLKAMYNSAIQFPDPAHSELAIWGNKERGFLPPKWGAGYLADKPERLDAYELQSIHYIGNSRLAVNVFYQNLQDVIAWYKPWTNMADLSGYGLEADFRWPINDRLTLWSNASLQRTKIDMRDKPGLYSYRDQYSTEAEYVVGVPGITANAGADIKITDDITFTTTIRYLSEMEYKRKWLALRKTHDHWNDWDVIRHEFYVDMSVLWENIGVDGLDFRVSAQNILGNRHLLPRQREVGDYGAEGPSLFATLMFSW